MSSEVGVSPSPLPRSCGGDGGWAEPCRPRPAAPSGSAGVRAMCRQMAGLLVTSYRLPGWPGSEGLPGRRDFQCENWRSPGRTGTIGCPSAMMGSLSPFAPGWVTSFAFSFALVRLTVPGLSYVHCRQCSLFSMNSHLHHLPIFLLVFLLSSFPFELQISFGWLGSFGSHS